MEKNAFDRKIHFSRTTSGHLSNFLRARLNSNHFSPTLSEAGFFSNRRKGTFVCQMKTRAKQNDEGFNDPVKYLSFTTQRTRLQSAQTVTHKRSPASVVPIGWPRSLSYRTARKICSFFGVKVYSCLVNPARSTDLPTSSVDVTNFLLIAQTYRAPSSTRSTLLRPLLEIRFHTAEIFFLLPIRLFSVASLVESNVHVAQEYNRENSDQVTLTFQCF